MDPAICYTGLGIHPAVRLQLYHASALVDVWIHHRSDHQKQSITHWEYTNCLDKELHSGGGNSSGSAITAAAVSDLPPPQPSQSKGCLEKSKVEEVLCYIRSHLSKPLRDAGPHSQVFWQFNLGPPVLVQSSAMAVLHSSSSLTCGCCPPSRRPRPHDLPPEPFRDDGFLFIPTTLSISPQAFFYFLPAVHHLDNLPLQKPPTFRFLTFVIAHPL